ncbi:MAG: hypothetical protein FJX23_00685 [Alphaproteobacteria bacterium]|nr:hypothetical protein [Alphaproteobacteria bacterium]
MPLRREKLTERDIRDLRDDFKKFEEIKDYSKYKNPSAARLVKVMNAQLIIRRMDEARADYGLLDPSGKRDGAEIANTIRGFLEQDKIDELRKDFQRFESIKDYSKYKSPEMAKMSKVLTAESLLREVKKQGRDFAILDASGERDGKEIEGSLRGFLRQHHIDEAREHLADLQKPTKAVIMVGPDYFMKKIDEELKKANADYSALDPEGKRGHFEAKHYLLDKAYKGAHVKCAQVKFQKLKDGIPLFEKAVAESMGGKCTPEKLAGEIKDHLKKADAPLASLAPGQAKSEREMAKELDDAVKNHKFQVGDPKEFAEQMKTLSTMPGFGRGRDGGRSSGGRGR